MQGPNYRGSYDSYTYGSAGAKPTLPANRRVSLFTVVTCFAAPCIQFVSLVFVLSFPARYKYPELTWVAFFGFAAVTLSCIALAVSAANKKMQGETKREPFWYIFFAATMLLSFFLGSWLGEINWWSNVLPYKNILHLSQHHNVDPAATTGQQYMDVGRIFFSEGTHVDLSKAVGFKNVDRYCVAPITPKPSGKNQTKSSDKLDSYDFWAIGINCCSGSGYDFQCGGYKDPEARAGLRLVRDDQQSFFRLAVQQAEATYNIKAKQPLFFFWMADPDAELASYLEDSKTYAWLGTTAFCAGQLILVLSALTVHSKL